MTYSSAFLRRLRRKGRWLKWMTWRFSSLRQVAPRHLTASCEVWPLYRAPHYHSRHHKPLRLSTSELAHQFCFQRPHSNVCCFKFASAVLFRTTLMCKRRIPEPDLSNVNMSVKLRESSTKLLFKGSITRAVYIFFIILNNSFRQRFDILPRLFGRSEDF